VLLVEGKSSQQRLLIEAYRGYQACKDKATLLPVEYE
jgi:hypothetical protein